MQDTPLQTAARQQWGQPLLARKIIPLLFLWKEKGHHLPRRRAKFAPLITVGAWAKWDAGWQHARRGTPWWQNQKHVAMSHPCSSRGVLHNLVCFGGPWPAANSAGCASTSGCRVGRVCGRAGCPREHGRGGAEPSPRLLPCHPRGRTWSLWVCMGRARVSAQPRVQQGAG